MINRSTTKEAAVLGKGSLATLHGHQTAWAATENWSFLRAQNINNRHCMMLPFFAVVVSLLLLLLRLPNVPTARIGCSM